MQNRHNGSTLYGRNMSQYAETVVVMGVGVLGVFILGVFAKIFMVVRT